MKLNYVLLGIALCTAAALVTLQPDPAVGKGKPGGFVRPRMPAIARIGKRLPSSRLILQSSRCEAELRGRAFPSGSLGTRGTVRGRRLLLMPFPYQSDDPAEL